MKSNTKGYCAKCGSNKERYLSVSSAALTFGCSEEAICGMIKRREIPFYKIGRRIRLSYTELKQQLVRYPSLSEIIDD